MHRVATEPGHLDHTHPSTKIEQTSAELIFISAADSDLSLVAQAWLPMFGDRSRFVHASALQHPETVEHYANEVLCHSRLIVLRLLGGASYFPHLLDELQHLRQHPERNFRILMLPGTEQWDESVCDYNDFSESFAQNCFTYLREGGVFNAEQLGRLLLRELDDATHFEVEAPQVMPRFGWYGDPPGTATHQPVVWLCFYRAWYQTGDLAVVDALRRQLTANQLSVRCCFAYSLRDPDTQHWLRQAVLEEPPQAILTTQSFAISLQSPEQERWLEEFDCPVLQLPVSLQDSHTWEHNPRGLAPAEVAMNVALPEIDGRVLATVVGFKEISQEVPEAQWILKRLSPVPEQVEFVAEMTQRWVHLRQLQNAEKRVAIILANYPNKDSRLGNGVGLDTPESVALFLKKLVQQGYSLGNEIPVDGEALITRLQQGITNDPEGNYGKECEHWLTAEQFGKCLGGLPVSLRQQLQSQWSIEQEFYPIAGFTLGKVFIGLQPPRGFGEQTQAIYHSPDLPPPPNYLAFYWWLRTEFQADAIIHFGKHGNLEWLPGRSVGLGAEDFPWQVLGPIPHLYPFIVNNPGEGTQAKRRSSAVIVDHLTPPLARAGLYDELQQVERLLEEHSHCETMFPERAHELEHQIEYLLEQASWREEIPEEEDWLNALSNFLCDIKESQIRSGLHIFGKVPSGQQRTEFLLSLLRLGAPHSRGLLHCLGDLPKDVDLQTLSVFLRDELNERAKLWVDGACSGTEEPTDSHELQQLRKLLQKVLLPRLLDCERETEQLLRGLSGKFIQPGPSGAPTRGRYDVLPTGRNFYAVDPRTIPTQTAWKCGQGLADRLLDRYREEHGTDLRHLALVIWGTSNMRTGGDDIAQALWLWGCSPVWEPTSGRLLDFEILPLSVLGRPRVDVVLRVSGLFRDAFGETMRLLAQVPKRLAELEEPEQDNPIRASWHSEKQRLQTEGIPAEQAQELAHLRVFSAGPGCYGTGLLPLLDAGKWQSKADLTEVFLKWGGHAYGTDGQSWEDSNLFKQRLSEIEVVHQNQDNREHDILDSDDYFQFQGGLHAAVEQIRGKAPVTYHGDSSNPEQLRIRSLKEEFNRVFRSRVLNPRWLEAMRRHGYKGAFEMAATVDYFFGYDATCDVASDNQYADLAQQLLLNPTQQEFFRRYNPQALRDATQRLLEAHERDLWENPAPDLLEQLRHQLLELQGELE